MRDADYKAPYTVNDKEDKSTIKIDGFFDIETSDWDKFALGGYYDPATGFISYNDSDEFGDYLLSRVGHIWAWNGGLFDFLWFLDFLSERGIKVRVSRAGTRITRIEVGRLVLRDACALVPSSLADAAPIAGMDLSKETGLPCICGKDCRGYCSITPRCEGMPPDWVESLKAYLELDCVAGLKILDVLFEHARAHGYTLKGTLGGSAWATAKDKLGLDDANWKKTQHYAFARNGYYGGRVTVGRIRASSGFRYDINSAYPAALSNLSLPVGINEKVSGKRARASYYHGKPGVYRAIVSVPRDCHLPPLPCRSPKGRVCYPIGRFQGTWTQLELSNAERYGARIEKMVSALVWNETAPVFHQFMADIFDVRASVGKKSALGKWQKLFGNSLTGKFAQSPESDRIIVNPDTEPVRCPGGDCDGNKSACRRRANKCCLHHCSGRCGAWKQVDLRGRIWALPYWSLPDCGYVHWAAYLTSYTRIVWLKFARQFGTHFLYGDTDSVYTSRAPIDQSDIGEKLGQFGFDGPITPFTDDIGCDWAGWDCIGPKAYKYWNGTNWHVRLKGVPDMDSGDYDRFRAGETIQSERGVMGFRSAAKRSNTLFKKKLIKRSDLSDGVWYGDRRLIPGTDITEPVTYGEQCRRERE